MRSFLFLLIHLLTTLARLLGPGGIKAVLAENLLIQRQLLAVNRSRRRASALSPADQIFMGWLSLFIAPRRLLRAAVAIKPATLLKFHRHRELPIERSPPRCRTGLQICDDHSKSFQVCHLSATQCYQHLGCRPHSFSLVADHRPYRAGRERGR